MLMNTGETPVFQNGLVTTIAWGLNGQVTYALEGSIFVAGAAIQWLRDEMRLIDSAAETRVYGHQGARYQRLLRGPRLHRAGRPPLGPVRPRAIVGLTRGVGTHIIRATLESLAYQTNDVLQAMEADSGIDVRAQGGRRRQQNYFMQTQADIISMPGGAPQVRETTAMGAYLAGAVGAPRANKEEVIRNWAIDRDFQPEIGEPRERR